jgi:hypothetical protein
VVGLETLRTNCVFMQQRPQLPSGLATAAACTAAAQGYWALHLLSGACGGVVLLTRTLAMDEAAEGVHRTLPPWMLWFPPVRWIGLPLSAAASSL